MEEPFKKARQVKVKFRSPINNPNTCTRTLNDASFFSCGIEGKEGEGGIVFIPWMMVCEVSIASDQSAA